MLDILILFKIGGAGIILVILDKVLTSSGKSEIAAITNIAGIVIISMALSFIFTKAPIFSGIDSGIKVIILTIVISLAAAILFPVKEEQENEKEAPDNA